MNVRGISLAALAARICEHCRRHGIDVVLSGGACVSIYTRSRYLSYDLDFRNPGTPFLIEFLSPPLSVGEEPVREIREMRRGKSTLRLLSPTDCVKDRLAAFYHWNDRQALDQALFVCRAAEVDVVEVERWSTGEGMKSRFRLFKKALESFPGKKLKK
jgi:hypothetical protein